MGKIGTLYQFQEGGISFGTVSMAKISDEDEPKVPESLNSEPAESIVFESDGSSWTFQPVSKGEQETLPGSSFEETVSFDSDAPVFLSPRVMSVSVFRGEEASAESQSQEVSTPKPFISKLSLDFQAGAAGSLNSEIPHIPTQSTTDEIARQDKTTREMMRQGPEAYDFYISDSNDKVRGLSRATKQ